MDIKFANCLTLDVLHSNYPKKRWAEMKFSDNTTLEAVKNTLFYRTGTPSHRMKLYAFYPHCENEAISLGMNDSLTLKELGVMQHMILMIVDEEKNNVFCEETNKTQTKLFTLTEDEYNNRLDNARKFISKIRAVQQKVQPISSPPQEIDHGLQSGQRCEVLSLGGVRGEILSIDKRPHHKGQWIRIKLDEPLGEKNVPECDDGYGCYISLATWKKKILIGDYPFYDILEDA